MKDVTLFVLGEDNTNWTVSNVDGNTGNSELM